MKLYIRNKPGWINFVHTVEELRQFEDAYIPGTKILIGDLATFNKSMLSKLLKLLEENPMLDCYSSRDVSDPVLLSRFMQVVKEPLELQQSISEESFLNSDRKYQAVQMHLDLRYSLKLIAQGRTKFGLTLLQVQNGG